MMVLLMYRVFLKQLDMFLPYSFNILKFIIKLNNIHVEIILCLCRITTTYNIFICHNFNFKEVLVYFSTYS